MSNWRVTEVSPADFLQLLYDEDFSEGDFSDQDFNEEDDENVLSRPHSPAAPAYSPRHERSLSPEAPAYSPLSSPRHDRPLSPEAYFLKASREERSRSRSPIRPVNVFQSAPSGVVLRIYDETGTPLESLGPEEEEVDEDYLVPDAHAMYVSPEGNERNANEERDRNANVRGRGGRRGGRRGVRGVRGRNGRGRGRQSRGTGTQWVLGHPLKEIWTTDEDVPPELVSLARDVVRNREMRAQGDVCAERNVGERNRHIRGGDSESEDEDFLDASDGISPHFEWSPMESFEGKEENFLPERTGSVRVHDSAYDAFRSYWDDDILSLIVTETNLYASKLVSAAFQSEWYPTNSHEILCLFSFWMMLGIIRMPTLASCFAVDPLLKTEVFHRIFTRKRYENLVRALHFVDFDPANDDHSSLITDAARNLDRLHRLRPIIDHLNLKFQSEYILDKDISLDESLTLWKGRLDFKQYIRSKAAKFGIKTFELCESTTGYLWSFLVYTGKQSSDVEQSPGVLKSTAIVKKLIDPLLNKGYRIFMDNWYNSPLLARFLKRNGTDCVGTLRPSRRNVPVLINKAPLRKGEIVARHSGDVAVLAWQDKKRVTMISTCHSSSVGLPRVPSRTPSRPIPFKPQVVLDYNKFMGGVDLKDQMLEPYLLERKRCNKWYMKLFKRLLNVSILNARTLLQSSTGKHHNHLAFRLHLVDTILTKHLSLCPLNRRYTVSISRSTHQQPIKTVPATHAHWPKLLEPTESSLANKRNYRKRCVVCLREGRKWSRSTFGCENCGVPLCIQYCFKAYHTTPSSSSS